MNGPIDFMKTCFGPCGGRKHISYFAPGDAQCYNCRGLEKPARKTKRKAGKNRDKKIPDKKFDHQDAWEALGLPTRQI